MSGTRANTIADRNPHSMHAPDSRVNPPTCTKFADEPQSVQRLRDMLQQVRPEVRNHRRFIDAADDRVGRFVTMTQAFSFSQRSVVAH